MTTSSPIAPPQALVQGVSQTNQAIPQIDSAVAALLAPAKQYQTWLGEGENASLEPFLKKCTSHSPNMPGYEKILEDAAAWNKTYRAEALSTLESVVSWTASFNSYYAQLQPLASQIAAGEQSAVAPFQAILQNLQNATKSIQKATDGVSQQLTSYELLIDGDMSALGGKLSQTKATQTTDEQTAQNDAQQASNIQDQMNDRSDVDKCWDDLTGQTKKDEASEQDDEDASQSAQNAANTAGNEAEQMASTGADLKGIADSVGSLSDGWNILVGNFTVLLSSENITTYDIFTPDQLAAVRADWNDLAKQAATLLPAAERPAAA